MRKRLPIDDVLTTGDGSDTIFKAISVGEKRRALRLENKFWKAMDTIGRAEQKTTAELISLVEKSDFYSSNLASALRSFVVAWLLEDRDALSEGDGGQAALIGQLAASPTPAFVLSSSRMLKFHNTAFQRYIKSNFILENTADLARLLKLQLDTSMEDVLLQLKARPSETLIVGFALGMHDRRLRGRFQAALATVKEEHLVIGYILP
ncbi:MAG: ribbon-helix-helix domain-containing protein [Notoacmeibacter sp.]